MSLQAPLLSQRVDLVEKDHAGRVAARRLKYLAEVPLALADPHVEHIGQTDGDELRAQFARRGPRDISLAAARRAVEQQTSAQSLAVHSHHLGVFQWGEEGQVQSAFDLLHSRDIRERYARPFGLPEVIRVLAIPDQFDVLR